MPAVTKPSQTPTPVLTPTPTTSPTAGTPRARSAPIPPTPAQELTAFATALHQRMRACDAVVRLELLALLIGGPKTVTLITREVGLDMPLVSRHLSCLKRAGLVHSRTERNRRIYAISDAVRVEIRDNAHELRLRLSRGGFFAIGLPAALVVRLHPELPRR